MFYKLKIIRRFKMPRLENWSIIEDSSNPYLAPECRKKRLQGNIYGDARFEDGTSVTTSSLQSIDIDKKIAQTKNTVYQLGQMSLDYQKFLGELKEIKK
jgi:hypothetical protein